MPPRPHVELYVGGTHVRLVEATGQPPLTRYHAGHARHEALVDEADLEGGRHLVAEVRVGARVRVRVRVRVRARGVGRHLVAKVRARVRVRVRVRVRARERWWTPCSRGRPRTCGPSRRVGRGRSC